VSDNKDRFREALDHRGRAEENKWARQHDEEIIARLREKYAKPIKCPVCSETLDPRAAIGLGGMACPMQHGAWIQLNTLEALRGRLANAAASHHESIGEKLSEAAEEVVAHLRKIHPKEIHCPDCNAMLAPRAAVAFGSTGLGGMACPNQHGAWVDRADLEKIRTRLDAIAGTPAR
jgi:Zn-finger nucleic acid-binding protein